MSPGRPTTIGLLTGWLDDSYHLMILQGALDAARECGAELVCFVTALRGVELSGITPLHQLIGPETFDGVIVTAADTALQSEVGRSSSLHLLRKVPLCSIAVEVPGASGVFVDNRSGLAEAIDHLVRRHSYRRIGFLCGPEQSPEAQQRLAVYRETLAQHGLGVDERLVVRGDFTCAAGERAVETLLDQRRVPIREVDAMLAANDGMALGFIRALSARGIRVPRQMAVVGFDDLPETRQARVPLTTVRQPLYEQGQQAVHLLLARIRGGDPKRSLLPTRLVTRRSCGCLEGIGSLTLDETDLLRGAPRSFELALLERRETMLADMRRAAYGQFAELGPGWEMRLVSALVEELKDRTQDAFRSALDDALEHIAAARGDLNAFHDVLSALWRNLLPCVLGDPALRITAEGLLDGGRLAVSAVAQRVRSIEYETAQSLASLVLDTSVSLCTSDSLERIAAVLEGVCAELGIYQLEIALCNGGRAGGLVRRVLSLREGKASLESTALRGHELLGCARPASGQSARIMSMLNFGTDVFGALCMDTAAPTGLVLEALRASLSAALHSLRARGQL
jgi:DNA-binding LacI/PurR family transcriptional regulator